MNANHAMGLLLAGVFLAFIIWLIVAAYRLTIDDRRPAVDDNDNDERRFIGTRLAVREPVFSDLIDVKFSPGMTGDEIGAHLFQALEPGQSTRIGIEYADAFGEVTRRVITVWDVNYSFQDHYMIRAYCHLRSDDRFFRSDRIMTLFDFKPRQE